MHNKALKVAWICHFSDQEVQEVLKPRRSVSQFAPWISYTIPVFEDRKDVELHIISPHEYINGTKKFNKNGVCYHFFNPYIPIWGRHWPTRFKWDVWTDYAKNKRIVRRIIERISPDIIHLQGAENPYYSSTALPIMHQYPLVVNLQRINLEFPHAGNKYSIKRAEVEKSILNAAKHFTIRTKTMENDFQAYRPDARIFWVNYAMPALNPIDVEKEYDIVFFAQVCKEKGIEDLLEAYAIVKQSLPETKLCVIGPVNDLYKEHLMAMAMGLGINDSIKWKGFLPELRDVHLEASKAKISVLPTYNDIISGTIIESMQLGLPVVSYKTGSIPELNDERENVLIVEKGDVKGIADNMLKLLTDANLYKTMSLRGIQYIKEHYSNQNTLKQHMDCYRAVIADFKKRGNK